MGDFTSKGGIVDEDKLEEAQRNNPALLRVRTLRVEKDQRNSGTDYNEWAEQKTRVSRAKKCLNCIDGPYEGENKSNDDDAREKIGKESDKN